MHHMDAVDNLLRANPIESLAIISTGLFANEKKPISISSLYRELCVLKMPFIPIEATIIMW